MCRCEHGNESGSIKYDHLLACYRQLGHIVDVRYIIISSPHVLNVSTNYVQQVFLILISFVYKIYSVPSLFDSLR